MTRAEKNIKWIEKHCYVPEGKGAGRPVKLREWQKDILRSIYDNPAGTRRAIISFGRKNGKTALVAFLLLLHLIGREAEPSSQLYSAAMARDQAALLFDLAAKCVRYSPTLRDHVQIKDAAKQILCAHKGTRYRALSADAPTNYGLSPVFIVHDELGQVRGPKSELYEALETATGGQEDPLSIIISTQAPNNDDLLSMLIDDAQDGHDPRTVLKLYTAPEEDDAFSEETIRKANPAFGDFQNATETLSMAEAAKRLPSSEAGFRNLILNQRVEIFKPFIGKSQWFACNGPVHDHWGSRPVYGGLDLSAGTDLTALVLTCDVDGVTEIKPTFWLPEEGLREKARQDRVQYDVWRDQGFLETTPGKTVEYDFVAEYVVEEVLSVMKVKKIGFDRWGFRHLRPCLVRAGMTEAQIEQTFVEFGQGFQSMSPALRALEGMILNGKVAHANHPVLAMCAGHAVVQRDPAGNRKLDKAKSRGRIDGMVALAMAAAVRETHQEEKKPEYNMLFV